MDNKPLTNFCLTETEVWSNVNIMSVNAAAGISMKLIMEFAHGITLQPVERI